MQGFNNCGCREQIHAGIATQARVEQLAKEGLSKYDLGREKFLERSGPGRNNMVGDHKQLKRLVPPVTGSGSALLDEGCSRCTAFLNASMKRA